MASLMPDYGQLITQWWGGDYENNGTFAAILGALNYVSPSGNPAWGVNEFLAVRSKFGGVALSPPPLAVLTLGSSVASVASAESLKPGMWVSDDTGAVPAATKLLAVGTYALTLNHAAVATAVNDVLLDVDGNVLATVL